MDRPHDGSALDFERFLLESAADEAPAPELRDRVLTAIGAAAAVGATAAVIHSASLAAQGLTSGAAVVAGSGTLAAGTAVGAETAVAATAGVAQVSAGVAVKALLIKGALLVATAGAATGVVAIVRQGASTAGTSATLDEAAGAAAEAPRPRRGEPPPPEPAVVPVQTPPEKASPESVAKRAPPSASSQKALESSAPVSAGASASTMGDAGAAGVALPPAAPPEHSDPAPPRVSPISMEVAALDRARAALTRGDAPAALSELAKYDAEFPSGALLHEKTVLEVRALQAAGQRQKARACVEKFLARHPGSAQAARLRALVE